MKKINFGTPISSGGEISSSNLPISQLKNDWFGYVNLIYGKKESGKTMVCLNLIKQLIWEKYVDKLIIVGDRDKYPSWATVYDSPHINDIYKYITDANNKSIKKVLVIDKEIFNGKVLDNLAANSFDYNLTMIITKQNLTSISPILMNCINYLFIMEETNNSNLKSLWDRFGGVFDKLETFKSAMKSITNNYTPLVIKKFGKTETVTDSVFWYQNKKTDTIGLTEVDTTIPLTEKPTIPENNGGDKPQLSKKEIIKEIILIKEKLDAVIEKLDTMDI